MRRSLYALALLLTAPAFAQEPDTTDWHLYYPLEVGNAWQYLYHYEPVGPDYYVALEIVGEVILDGEAYFSVQRCTRSAFEKDVTCEEEPRLIRYDEEHAAVVERVVVGGEIQFQSWLEPCRLDLPLKGIVEVECFDGSEQTWIMGGAYGEDTSIGADPTPLGTLKSFGTGFGPIRFLSGIGMLDALIEYEGPHLVYARVGGVEYGEQAIVLAADDAASPGGSSLAVFPNPMRDVATLRFTPDVPQRLSLAVYDVQGRRVRAVDLGVQGAGEGALRFDAGDLPPGAYRLRLLGDGGFVAAQGVIVLR